MRIHELSARYLGRQHEIDVLRRHPNVDKPRLDVLWLDSAWWRMLVTPIFEFLLPHFPDYRLTMADGPQGVSSTVHIWVEDPNLTGGAYERLVGGIAFRPGDLAKGNLRVIDYSQHLDTFAPGSVGWLNGLNFPDVPCPDDPNDILAQVQASIRARTIGVPPQVTGR
jgi:hypothetical protein